MSVSFNPGVSPDEYAQTYATQNNMSLADAKVALKEKYGDPQQPQNVSVWTDANEVSKTSEDNAADTMLNIDPNFIAQLYADQQGMSLDEAIADLEEKLGIPSETGITDTIKNFIKNIIDMVKGNGEGRPDQGVDPEVYAQEYADENGITLDEAKAELKEKFGEPVKPEEGKTAETTEAVKPDPGIDPEAYAQQYADEKGITLEEAKAELSAQHGEPVQPDENDNEAVKPQFDQNQDPDFYVRLYAAENNITYEEAKAYFESQYGAFN